MIYASVCDGISAASVAWHPLGWRPAFLSEIAPFPRAVLAARQGAVDARRTAAAARGTPLWGDFTAIRPRHLKRLGIRHVIDLLVGGTPCQSFSIAGLRGGLDDERGNLALEYLRLARRLRPRWLVWENVPGVLSSNGGRDFGAILGGMVQLGYGIAYRVLDAQFFGVPQRRRRVFVVGYLGDWRRAAAVLFERESLRGDSAPRREARKVVTGTVAGGARKHGGYSSDDIPLTTATLDASFGRLQGCSGQDANHGHSHLIAFGGNNTRGTIDVSTALNAHGGPAGRLDFESETLVCAPIPFDTTQITSPACRSNPRAGDPCHPIAATAHPPAITVALRGHEGGAKAELGGEVATALRASSGGGDKPHTLTGAAEALTASWHNSNGAKAGNQIGMVNPIIYPSAVRRLTPRECERLQGFPDDYTAILYRGGVAADGPRYKALGNSMAVPVMRWIGERIAMVDAIAREAA